MDWTFIAFITVCILPVVVVFAWIIYTGRKWTHWRK